MSLSHCIHQTLNSKASTRFHSGGLQQSCTLILNTFLFGVIILIANILKRAFSSQLAAKLRNRLLVRSEERFSRNAETDLVCRLLLEKKNKTKKTNKHLRTTTQTHKPTTRTHYNIT